MATKVIASYTYFSTEALSSLSYATCCTNRFNNSNNNVATRHWNGPIQD